MTETDEKKLIEELTKYENLAKEYKIKLHNNHANNKAILESKLVQILNQITVVEKDLVNQVNRPITANKKAALIKIIPEIINALKPLNETYTISRNQGMVVRNYLYGKVIGDLNNAFEYGDTYLSSPEYCYDIDQNVNYLALQDLLKASYNELLVGNFNYISLRTFFEKIKHDIKQLSELDE